MSDDTIIEHGEQASLALGELSGTVRGLEDANRLWELLDALESTSENLRRTILEVARYARGRTNAITVQTDPVDARARAMLVGALRDAAQVAESVTNQVQRAISAQAGLEWPNPGPSVSELLDQRTGSLDPDPHGQAAGMLNPGPGLQR